MVRERGKATVVGIGLDRDESDEIRVTRGRNFRLIGGSEQTHEQMQEKCIKLNEKLQDRGKELDDLEGSELLDMARECEINLLHLRRSRQ